MKNTTSKISLSIVVLLVAVLIVIILAHSQINSHISNPKTLIESAIHKNDLSLDAWHATIVDIQPHDTKLVLINRTSHEKKELIPSLNTFLNNANPLLQSIRLQGDTNYGDVVYVCTNTEYGCSQYFAININTITMREIKNTENRLLPSPLGDRGLAFLSVGMPSIKTSDTTYGSYENNLELICFTNDSKKSILTLPQGQVFNASFPELDDTTYLKWIDHHTIEFNIYTQSADYKDANSFLKKETLTVPDCE